MYRAVRATKRENRCDKSHEETHPFTLIPARIQKQRPHIRTLGFRWRHDSNHDEHDDEKRNVQNQDGGFDAGQPSCEKCVEGQTRAMIISVPCQRCGT
jgi:hypothetical protein